MYINIWKYKKIKEFYLWQIDEYLKKLDKF